MNCSVGVKIPSLHHVVCDGRTKLLVVDQLSATIAIGYYVHKTVKFEID